MEKFEITEEHLKLAKRMYVSWEDCEYGAPSINCKRPYGNSDVEDDICEILGFERIEADYEEVYSTEDLKYAEMIHLQMETVLQICLKFLEFKTGVFTRKDKWEYWERSKNE